MGKGDFLFIAGRLPTVAYPLVKNRVVFCRGKISTLRLWAFLDQRIFPLPAGVAANGEQIKKSAPRRRQAYCAGEIGHSPSRRREVRLQGFPPCTPRRYKEQIAPVAPGGKPPGSLSFSENLTPGTVLTVRKIFCAVS